MSAVDPTAFEPPAPLEDAGAAADRRSARREKLRLFVRNPSAIIGGAILIFWIICAVFGDVIAPYSPFATDFDGHVPPGGSGAGGCSPSMGRRSHGRAGCSSTPAQHARARAPMTSAQVSAGSGGAPW